MIAGWPISADLLIAFQRVLDTAQSCAGEDGQKGARGTKQCLYIYFLISHVSCLRTYRGSGSHIVAAPERGAYFSSQVHCG